MTLDVLPHQRELLEDNTTKILGMVCGYGAGKTWAVARKALVLASLNPGCDGIVTEPNFPLLYQILIPEIIDALEQFNLAYVFNKAETTFVVSITGIDTRIICKSMERYDRLIGINAAWCICDEFDTAKEELAYQAYLKLLGRLRAGSFRQFVIATTPEGFRAAYRIFVKEMSAEKKLIRARTTDNIYLPADYIETLYSMYPENLIEAYINGQFVNLTSGAVYHYFDRARHVKTLKTEKLQEVHVGQDFNVGGCVSVVCRIVQGRPQVLNTIVSHDTNSIIDNLKTAYPDIPVHIYPDASGHAQKTNSSRSDIQLLREAGFIIHAPRMNGAVRDRVNSLNQLFYTNMIDISESCTSLVEALEQQAYDERGEPQKFPGAATIDDYNDALGYFVVRCFGLTRPKYSVVTNDFI